MVALIVIVSLGIGVLGLLSVSVATQGVGIIAFACLLMIFARIVQADAAGKRVVLTQDVPRPSQGHQS